MPIELRLRLRRYRFRFEAIDMLHLPAFAGSTWRGMLGHALRDIACVRACRSAAECPRRGLCAYRLLFETPPPPEAAKMRLYDRVPHPFVLDANGTGGAHPPGQIIELGVVLVGRANQQVEQVREALALAADRGAGRGRGRLRLVCVEAELRPGADQWHLLGEPTAEDVGIVPDAAPAARSVVADSVDRAWLHAGRGTSMGLGKYRIENRGDVPVAVAKPVEATLPRP